MRITKLNFLLMLLLSTMCFSQVQSQDEVGEISPIEFSADLVSRYVWRGLLYSAAPNLQPTISYTKGGFSAGAWGSYGVGQMYAEADIFVSYTFGNFTFTVFDYYVEDESDLSVNNYFMWGRSTTPHSLEGTIAFNGTENFPISITAATFFYGNDWDENDKNYYSTYFEVGYSKALKDVEFSLFAGGTPAAGLYASKAAIVNVGFSLSKQLKITDSFSLPVYISFVVNPRAKDIFMVFGITL